MKKLNILIKNSKKITPLGEKRVVKSKVIGWDTKHVYLNIGVKKESSVLKKEFTAFNKKLSVGLFVNILVDKVNFKLSNHKVSFIKAQFILNWAFINLKYNEGDIIKGKIIDCTKGGFTTNVGVFSFLPLSQINLQVPKNTSSFLNKCFFFKILKINYEKKNLILSRREIIEQERTDKKKKLLKNVSVGNVCWGVIKNITTYGIFIDINGIDGLLHVTDISWDKNKDYRDLKIEQAVKVIIVDINKEKCRVSLGIKQLSVNQHTNTIKKLNLGLKTFRDSVSNNFFNVISNTVEAFKLNSGPSNSSSLLVSYVDSKQNSVFLENNVNKVSSWVKLVNQTFNDPTVSCIFKKLFKCFLYTEFSNKIQGVLHTNDLNWTRFEDPKSSLGSPIDIKLLSKDIKNSRVILGKKQVQPNPFDILKAFSVGDIVVGKVIRIVNYGAFIKINKRLDGLLHASQFDSVVLDKKNNDIKGFNIKSNTIRPDEYIKAIIIKIDTTNFKVSLSLKASYYNEEKFKSAIKEYSFVEENRPNHIELSNLGDFFNFKS